MIEVITTVTMPATSTAPAGPYDLIDLATAKDELKIQPQNTADDSFLSRAITQASITIKTFCNRTFQIESLSEIYYVKRDVFPWFERGRVDPLQLTRWPMVGSGTVSFTGNTHGTNVIDGIASTAGLLAGQPVFGGGAPAGTTIGSVTSSSVTLAPTSVVLTAATAVAFTAGLSVVQTIDVGVTQTLVQDTDFKVNADRGQLFRQNNFTGLKSHWEFFPVTAIYSAGYATVPNDVQDAVLRLITARYKARSRDPMMTSQTQGGLGTQNYWIGAAPGQHGALPPEIRYLVEAYRVPQV